MEYKIYDILKSEVYGKIIQTTDFMVLADNSRGVYIPQHVMGLFGIELDMADEFYDEDFYWFEGLVNDLLLPYGLSMGYTENGDYLVTRLEHE